MSGSRAAMILAAGASQRMGTPKALLAWGGTTLLDYALQQARNAGATEIVVVLGPATQHLEGTLAGVRLAFNPAPETGRSASIRLAADVLPDAVAAILIQSVDQPVPSDIVASLFAALAADGDIAVPTFNGRRGHPVCLAGHLLGELRRVHEEDEGLRSVVRRHAAGLVEIPVTTDAVLWNLNDPAAYAAAQASLSS